MHERALRDGLVCGYVLDGRGGAREIESPLDVHQLAEGESLWLHWDRSSPAAHQWLRERSGLSSFACDLLLEEATRPRRLLLADDSLLLFLRGVNLNPGAAPEDMVTLRIHADARRVVTLRLRPLKSVQLLSQAFGRGQGPRTPAELVLFLAQALTDGITRTVEALVDDLDDLEDRLEADERLRPDRQLLLALRRRSAGFHRYVGPQRDIFPQMISSPPRWMGDGELDYWNELHNRLTRNLEDLELARERVSLLQEAEHRHVTERMNRTMYLLGIITGFFMPLTFITGLLGMNVAGIPWAREPLGFMLVCVLLAVIASGQWLLYRRLRWM